MTKLTLPQETIRPNGIFFSQMLEATARGCTLVWNSDYTSADLYLDTTIFLTKEDIKNIINSGGEIENLLTFVKLDKNTYETSLIPEDIVNYINPEFVNPTWKTLFLSADYLEDENKYRVSLVPCTQLEPLPMSIVLSEFGGDFDF